MLKGHNDLSIFSVVWLQKNIESSNGLIIMFTCHVIVFIGYVDWSILSVVRLKTTLSYSCIVMSLCHVIVFISHIDWSTGSVVWLNKTVNLSDRCIITSTRQVYVISGHVDWYTLGVVGFKTMLVCPTVVLFCL